MIAVPHDMMTLNCGRRSSRAPAACSGACVAAPKATGLAEGHVVLSVHGGAARRRWTASARIRLRDWHDDASRTPSGDGRRRVREPGYAACASDRSRPQRDCVGVRRGHCALLSRAQAAAMTRPRPQPISLRPRTFRLVRSDGARLRPRAGVRRRLRAEPRLPVVVPRCRLDGGARAPTMPSPAASRSAAPRRRRQRHLHERDRYASGLPDLPLEQRHLGAERRRRLPQRIRRLRR